MDGDLLSDDEKVSFLFTPLHYEDKVQVNQVRCGGESDKKSGLVKDADNKAPESSYSLESSLVELDQSENTGTETSDIVLEEVNSHQKQQEEQQQQQRQHKYQDQEQQSHSKLSKRLRSQARQPRDYEIESESFKFISSIAVEDESEEDNENYNGCDNNIPLPDDDNFESEPSLEDYVTLTTKLCDIEEVYLLNVGGLRSSIPRRKIGSWINVSRYKIFLNKVDIKKLENDLLLCRKKVLLDDAKLPSAYQGYWTPLATARMFARKYKIYSNVRPLLIFNRIARTIYCGFEFFEMFVHIDASTSIRVLRRCDNHYLNLNQLFDVYDAVKGPRARKNLRRLFLNEYISKNMPLIRYGDATLCGGNWVPLLQAREFCDYYELTSYVAPILAFAKSPAEGLQKVSRLEYALLNNWKIIDSNFVSTKYQLNTLKRFHGFPMNFRIPKHHKIAYKHLKKLIREEHTKRKKLAKLVHHYNNYYKPEYHNQDFKITKTSLKSEIFGLVKNLMEMKKEYLNRLGRVIHIRLKESKRKVFTDYYVFRRYSDGKVNLSSLLSAVVALRLNKLSRSDKDPDMQIENELYYRDTLNLVETDEVYMNFSDSFLNYLNQSMFQEQELENSRDLIDSLSLKNEVLTVLKTCINGKWGDINVARDIFKEFHFNVDDNAQHYKLNEILYSSQFVDSSNISDDDDGTVHNSDLDGPDSDLEIIDEPQKGELGILFKRSIFDGVPSDGSDGKDEIADKRIPLTEVSNYEPKSTSIPIVSVSDESDLTSDGDDSIDGKGYTKFKLDITKPKQQQTEQQRQQPSSESVDSNSSDYEDAQSDEVPAISSIFANFTPKLTKLSLNSTNSGTKLDKQGQIATNSESTTLNCHSFNSIERNSSQDTSAELNTYDSGEQISRATCGFRMGKKIVKDIIHGYKESKATIVGLSGEFGNKKADLSTVSNNGMDVNQKYYLNRKVESEIFSDQMRDIADDNEKVGYGRVAKESNFVETVEKSLNSNDKRKSKGVKYIDYSEIMDSEKSANGEDNDDDHSEAKHEKRIQQAVNNESHHGDIPVAKKKDTKRAFEVEEDNSIDTNRIDSFSHKLNNDDYNGSEYQQTLTAVSGEDSLSEHEYFNDNGMNDNDPNYVDGTSFSNIEETETTIANSVDSFVESRPHDVTMPNANEDDNVAKKDSDEEDLEVANDGDIFNQMAGNFVRYKANENHFSLVNTTSCGFSGTVRHPEVQKKNEAQNQNEAVTGPVSEIAVEDHRNGKFSFEVDHNGTRIKFYKESSGEESQDKNLANDINSKEEEKSDSRVREQEILDNINHSENNLITPEVNSAERKITESFGINPTIAVNSTYNTFTDIHRKFATTMFFLNTYGKKNVEHKASYENNFGDGSGRIGADCDLAEKRFDQVNYFTKRFINEDLVDMKPAVDQYYLSSNGKTNTVESFFEDKPAHNNNSENRHDNIDARDESVEDKYAYLGAKSKKQFEKKSVESKTTQNNSVKDESAKNNTETKKHVKNKFVEHHDVDKLAEGKLERKRNRNNELSEGVYDEGIDDETINFELDTSSEDEEFQTKLMEEIDRIEKKRQKMFGQIAVERSTQQQKLKCSNKESEDFNELSNTTINNFQSTNGMRHKSDRGEVIQPVSQKSNSNMNRAKGSNNDDFSLVGEVTCGGSVRKQTVKSPRNGNNVRKLIIKYVDEHGVHRSRHISTAFDKKDLHSTPSFEFTKQDSLSINKLPNFYNKPGNVVNSCQLTSTVNHTNNSIDDDNDAEIINLTDEEEMSIAERLFRSSKAAYRSARPSQPLAMGSSSKEFRTSLALGQERPASRRAPGAVPVPHRKKRTGTACVSSGSKSRKRSRKKIGTSSNRKRPKVESVGSIGNSIGGSSGSIGLATDVSSGARAAVFKSALLDDSDSDFEFTSEIIPSKASKVSRNGRNKSFFGKKSEFEENKFGNISDHTNDTEKLTNTVTFDLTTTNKATSNGLNGSADNKNNNNAAYGATSDLNNDSEDDAVLLGVNIFNNKNDKRKAITTTLAKRRQKLVQKRLKKRTSSNRIENSGAQLPGSNCTNINNSSKTFLPVDNTSESLAKSNDEDDVDEDGGEIIKLGINRWPAFAKASCVPQLNIIGKKIVSLLTNNIITQDNNDNINQVKLPNKDSLVQTQPDFALSNNFHHGQNYYEYMLSNNLVPIVTISSDSNQKADDVNYEVAIKDKSVMKFAFSNKGNDGFSGAKTSAQTVTDTDKQRRQQQSRTLAKQVSSNESKKMPTMIVVLRFNNVSRYKLAHDQAFTLFVPQK